MDRKFLVVLVTIFIGTLAITGISPTLADTTDNNSDTDSTQHLQKSSLTYFQQISKSQWSQIDPEIDDIEPEPELNIVEGTADQAIILQKDGTETTVNLTTNPQTTSNPGGLGLVQNYPDIPQSEIQDQPSDTEFDQRSVIGSDDRIQIGGTTSYPWRADGYVSTGCTGALIEPDVVLTAGHCVNDGNGNWFRGLEFYPGRDGSTKPYGSADWTNMVTYKRWAEKGDSKYDLAIVELDRNIGNVVGWYGRMTRGSSHPVYDGILNTAGYPGDKSGITMWFHANPGVGTAFGGHFVAHKMDTAGGQSGSPVWAYYPGSSACPGCRYITSVHTYGDTSDKNFANRLTPNKYDHINNWMNKYFSAPTPQQTSKTHGPSKDHPDLVDDGKQWSSANPTTTSSGEQINIQHDIRNIGTANVTPIDSERQLNVQYYLSENQKIDESDTNIGEQSRAIRHGELMPFRYIDVGTELEIPESIGNGNYNLCFRLDSTNDIPEFNEENNDACLDEQIQITRQFTISVDDPVTPGGNVSITITAENVGGISISDIPTNWNIQNTQNDGGIFTPNDENNDGHNESAGWAWLNTGTKNPTMTLNVPENAVEQNYTLNSSIQNGDSVSKQFTIQVAENNYDQDGDGEIDGGEVRLGIRCFLFGGDSCIGPRLGGQQIRDLIIRFLGI